MNLAAATVTLHALPGIPDIRQGDDLAAIICRAAAGSGAGLQDGDIVVLAQKIVSKSEGRSVRLADVTPSPTALSLARDVDKDPRLVELILSESVAVMRAKPGVLIMRHRLGLVLANSGIDQSNVDHSEGEQALLLPLDPDASARCIRAGIKQIAGATVAVAIIDSLGRAWRLGTTGVAIGAAGLPGLLDLRGQTDMYDRTLMTSELGLADEVAAAASLVMGQAAERTPVVVLRGLNLPSTDGSATELLRPVETDLFP